MHSLSKIRPSPKRLGLSIASHMKIPWADSYFLKLALSYWEKYTLVSRAASILLRPMEEICSVHWGTQSRCIFHRAIYSHIDIQDRLRTISNAVQVSLVSTQLKVPIKERNLVCQIILLSFHSTPLFSKRQPKLKNWQVGTSAGQCAATVSSKKK